LRAAVRGFIFGYFWALTAFWFLREIEPVVPFAMAGVLALFITLWAAAIPSLERCLLLPVKTRLLGSEALAEFHSKSLFREILLLASLSALWCLTEWLRSWVFTGLPWDFLGSTQWHFITLIQICEWTGVYGISFVMIAANIALAMLLAPTTRWRWAPAVFAALLLLAALFVGLLPEKKANTSPIDVALVQCDISQRRHANIAQAQEALDVCMNLSEKAIAEASKAGRKLSFIIWPETAVPYPLLETSSSFSLMYRYRLFDLIRSCQTPFLLGSLFYGDIPERDGHRPAYNAALLIDTTPKLADFYFKEHLVPFGEFVPLGDKFPKFNKALGMGRNLKSGTRFNPLEVSPSAYAGISICYEDVFPYISRAHALNGANLLLVITNDAWYPKSSEPEQHFINAVFRAVETRLPLLRCGNSNYSVLISPRGEILDSVSKPDPGTSQRATALMRIDVPLRPSLTFHTLYGDVFVLLCGFIAGFGILTALLNWRDLKKALLESLDAKKDGQLE